MRTVSRLCLCFLLVATTAAAQDLAQGSSGPAVRTLQRALNVWRRKAGLGALATDGALGPKTAAALRDLQRARGVAPTGALDGPTLAALRDAVGASPLGSIDPIRSPTHDDLYRPNGSSVRDVALHRLPAVTVGGKTSRPIVFETGLAIDADGAGSAWRTDPAGQPNTSLRWPDGRSLDPTVTPFYVLPKGFRDAHPEVAMGDVAAVVHGGKVAFAIWGDVGPRGHLGEGSIALAKAIGVDANPVHGGTASGVFFVVFPGSGSGGPLLKDDIDRRGRAFFVAAGGVAPP